MKNLLFFVVFIITSLFVFPNEDSLYVYTKAEYTVYSLDLMKAKVKVHQFFRQNEVQLISQNERKKDLNFQFELTPDLFFQFDSLTKELGYISNKRINSTSNVSRVNEAQLELTYLKEKKESYNQLLSKLNVESEKYLLLWDENKQIEGKIFTKEKELLSLKVKANIYQVTFSLYEEINNIEQTKVSFVNMPGFEYSYLTIDSPKEGLSADYYQGFFIKYLFTRGKSFATVGAYKNLTIEKTDEKALKEMFVFGFGQDFYSRYLGRGTKRFFNLYSGYIVGGAFGSSKDDTKVNVVFISPAIGLELFKNRYMLVDSKVSYFIPLGNHNANLRGVNASVSLNFVF